MQFNSRSSAQSRSPFQGFLPFFWMALVALGGVWLADSLSLPPWGWGAGFTLVMVCLILAKTLPPSLHLTHHLRHLTRADQRLPGALLVAVFLVAGWRAAALKPVISPETVAYYNGSRVVQISGRVVQPPEPRDGGVSLTVAVDSLKVTEHGAAEAQWIAVQGKALVQAPSSAPWAYGDQVRAVGKLETPPENADFSYQTYLARKGILSLMSHARVNRIGSGKWHPLRAFIYGLRDRSAAALQDMFSSPESDLLAGILLGSDQGLSPELQAAFRETGATHIIAISGFNIAILAGIFSSLFTRLLGRKWGALIATLGIAGYTILVGAEAAVVRAAIMGSLGVLGGMFGRRQNGLNSLGFAVLAMTLINPNLPWDIGFQLSVAATLGLVLYAQPLEERCLAWVSDWAPEEQAQKWVAPFSEFFLYTLAAQLMTLPLLIYHFRGFSWLALLANPLILPVQPLVMVLGGLSLLTFLLLPGLGKMVAVVAQPFVTYTVRMVTWLAGLVDTELVFRGFHPLWLGAIYALLFILTLLPRDQRQALFHKALSPQLGALALLGVTSFVWARALSAPDGALRLTLLDSEGSVLIQSPGGETVLIGGGARPSTLKQRLGERLPAGSHHLDVLVTGSTYREDLNALTGALTQYRPESAWCNGDPDTNQSTRTVATSLSAMSVPVTPLEIGQVLRLDQEVELSVLWHGKRGAVFWLRWQNFSALLPTGKVEDAWLDVPASPDLVLLPDKMTPETVPLDILIGWQPAVILHAVSETDLGFGDAEAWQSRWEGLPAVTTLEHDWVQVATDGARLWVHAE